MNNSFCVLQEYTKKFPEYWTGCWTSKAFLFKKQLTKMWLFFLRTIREPYLKNDFTKSKRILSKYQFQSKSTKPTFCCVISKCEVTKKLATCQTFCIFVFRDFFAIFSSYKNATPTKAFTCQNILWISMRICTALRRSGQPS